MNRMKQTTCRRSAHFYVVPVLLLLFAIGGSPQTARGQWATSSNNINNTNTDNVGVGTTTPQTKLSIMTGSGYANHGLLSSLPINATEP